MQDVSEDVLKKSREYLQESAKDWVYGVCKGTTTYLDRFHPLSGAHTACHSWVTYAYGHLFESNYRGGWHDYPWDTKYHKDAKPFLVLNVYSRTRAQAANISAEDSDFLVRWVSRESPFSEFILNRDDDDLLTEGGLILMCGPGGLSLPQVMWVCKVLRFITEGDKAASVFRCLVEGGVDGMLAIYIASLIRSTAKGASFGFTGAYGHMSVVNGGNLLPIAMLKRSLNSGAADSSSVFRICVKDLPSSFKPDKDPAIKVSRFCKPFQKPDGWGGFIDGVGVTKEDIIKRALKWQQELSVCLQPVYDTPKMPDGDTVYLDLDL